MATQKIIWTVLPKGINDKKELLVSLVPSFRLTPENDDKPVLKTFPDLHDWPRRLAESSFALNVDGFSNPPFVLEPLPDARSDVWTEVFAASLPVAGHVYNDLSRHNLRSFPVRTVVSYLHAHYGALAESDGLQRPSLFGPDSPLQHMLGAIGIDASGRKQGGIGRWFSDRRSQETGTTELEARLNELYFSDHGVAPSTVVGIDGRPRENGSSYIRQRKLRRAMPASLSGPAAAQFHSDSEYALYQANRFYQRPENTRPHRKLPVAGATSAPIKPPEFDFHRMAASFADAPALMRQLGLVIDAVVRDGKRLLDLAAQQPNELLRSKMRLTVKGPGWRTATQETMPSTAFWLTPRRFVCDTRTDRHHAGLLRLGGARPIGKSPDLKDMDRGFALTSVDPDGAALKTIGFALSLQDHLAKVADPLDPLTLSQPGELSYTTSPSESVAALRSQGITLVEHGRAGHVADDAIASSLKNEALEGGQGDKIVWFAEDVLRGYRVDIFDEGRGQ